MTTRATMSAVLAVRDEEEMIAGALELLRFCDEIIVMVDDRTTDRTVEIAQRYTEHVHPTRFTSFAAIRNEGIARATGDWIVLTDADERVTPRLAAGARAAIDAGTDRWAFELPLVNFFWGRRMRFGAWNETHVRIARRERMSYRGDVHELLQIPPERIGWLDGELWHFSHRSIEENLVKTIRYGRLQSRQSFDRGAPPVGPLTFLRVMLHDFARRMIRRAGWRDGMPGLIEGIFQPFALFCAAVMLWERQQGDAVAARYAELEQLAREQR